jgi:hypothetical protein
MRERALDSVDEVLKTHELARRLARGLRVCEHGSHHRSSVLDQMVPKSFQILLVVLRHRGTPYLRIIAGQFAGRRPRHSAGLLASRNLKDEKSERRERSGRATADKRRARISRLG